MALGVAACAFFFHGMYYDAGIKNLVDLGVLSVDAERILDGQVFGRDFIAPYGPGRYYLVAGAFRIFGTSMGTLLAVFLVMRVLVDAGTYLVARRLMPLLPALGVTLCAAAAHGPTHKGFLTLGLVLLIHVAARCLEKPSSTRSFILGAAAAAAGSFRYDLGGVGLVLGVIALAAGRRPGEGSPVHRGRWPAFLGGWILLALPAGILLLWGDPSRLLDYEWIRAGLLREARSPDEGTLAVVLSILLLASPPGALLLGFLARRSSRTRESGQGLLLLSLVALAGMLLFTQYLIEPKVNRLLQVGPPLFICSALFSRVALGRLLPEKARWWSAALPVLLAGWYVIVGSGGGSIDSPAVLLRDRVRLEGERAGFSCGPRLAGEIAVALDWAERSVREGTFYASPSIPLLYFLSGKGNPAPITDFSYLLRNREAQEWVIDALKEKKVRWYLERPGIIQGFVLEEEAPRFCSNLRAIFPRSTPLPNGYRVYGN